MPDIHWHVGEGAGRETIAKATEPHRSRRSWIAILVVVAIGAGLGAVYRSIPEPAPQPTPSPSPTPRPTPTLPAIPAQLFASIDREAQALASGAIETVMALHTPQEKQVAERQRLNFRAWGRPRDGSPLYTIIDFDLRSQTDAWADIRKFRNGRWFRETRFYRWGKERWLRSDPDPFFWSGQTETLDTQHFHVIYFVEDRDLILPFVTQLENIYVRLCDDLGCATTGVTYTLALNSSLNTGWPVSGDGRTIVFPPPRVAGVYDDTQPIGPGSRDLIFLIAASAIRDVTGRTLLTREEPRAGDIMLGMVTWWAVEHVQDLPFNRQDASFQNPLPLADLWGLANQSNQDAIYREAHAVIYFIEQEYGAQSMPKLLKALGTAESFADVIENGLGVPFAEFDQKWQAWVKQNLEAPR